MTKFLISRSTHASLVSLLSRTDHLIYRDSPIERPDGMLEYDIPDEVLSIIREHAFEGETDEETIVRLLAIANGQTS